MKFFGYFRLLDFHVSHYQVLIRKTDSEASGDAENKDILISGTEYFGLPTKFHDFELQIASQEDVKDFNKKIKILPGKTLFKFIIGGNGFFVLADKVHFQTNRLNPSESSIPMSLENFSSTEDIMQMIDDIVKLSHEQALNIVQASGWTEFKGNAPLRVESQHRKQVD